MAHRLGTLWRGEDGNVATLCAFAMVPLLAMVGTGLDLARMHNARTQMQNAVDAAVLAAVDLPPGEIQIGTGEHIFLADIQTSRVQNPSVSFERFIDGSLAGTATATMSTNVLGLANSGEVTVTATSRAMQGTTPTRKVCILLLEPRGQQAFLANTGAKIEASGCEIHVASSGTSAAIVNGGTAINVSRLCVAGGAVLNGGAKTKTQANCGTIADPFAGTLPRVSVVAGCTASGKTYEKSQKSVRLGPGRYCSYNFNGQTTVRLSPGTYDNVNFSGSPAVTLDPGLYVIRNVVTFNSRAKLTGAGVTFYFADANSKIQFNGDVTAKLSAPASGAYQGILFFEPAGLAKSAYVMNAMSNTKMSGLIYLPSRNVTVNSVSTISSTDIAMVFNTLLMNVTKWSFAISGAGRMTAGPASAEPPYLIN